MKRRYTIHPPQLVGRLSPPQPGEDPVVSFRRLLGEWDAAMQELQRFLRYALDANDSAQDGQGIVGVVGGSVSHPSIADRDVAAAHPATAVTVVPSGDIVATNAQAAVVELAAEKVPRTRTIATTAPLQGGGDLTANRTLTIDAFTGDSGAGGAPGAVPAPAAGDAAAGMYLKATGGWAVPPVGGGGATPTGTGLRHVTAGVEDAAAVLVVDADVAAAAGIVESKLALGFPTHSNANDPSAGEKAALAGTSGAPGAGNKYVTDADARNADARAPTAHSHVDGDLPAGLARDAEVVAAFVVHEAAADPHTNYQRESEKGAASGYASLDAATLVPVAQIPALPYLAAAAFVGLAKITVGASAPGSPGAGDLWVDTT
jgi:hypothetical protein